MKKYESLDSVKGARPKVIVLVSFTGPCQGQVGVTELAEHQHGRGNQSNKWKTKTCLPLGKGVVAFELVIHGFS
jgi:hypothetical protein